MVRGLGVIGLGIIGLGVNVVIFVLFGFGGFLFGFGR